MLQEIGGLLVHRRDAVLLLERLHRILGLGDAVAVDRNLGLNEIELRIASDLRHLFQEMIDEKRLGLLRDDRIGIEERDLDHVRVARQFDIEILADEMVDRALERRLVGAEELRDRFERMVHPAVAVIFGIHLLGADFLDDLRRERVALKNEKVGIDDLVIVGRRLARGRRPLRARRLHRLFAEIHDKLRVGFIERRRHEAVDDCDKDAEHNQARDPLPLAEADIDDTRRRELYDHFKPARPLARRCWRIQEICVAEGRAERHRIADALEQEAHIGEAVARDIKHVIGLRAARWRRDPFRPSPPRHRSQKAAASIRCPGASGPLRPSVP